ncbi:type IV secretory system conjugative DNA transfer family protein [Noviherbaspirillum sp.]|uniref:type IV secretory system conjugative DNA transfer family protein n=1 Tax=Noviherbaspirillum sp. TaxID=1926288 RepID=UPI002FDFBFD4
MTRIPGDRSWINAGRIAAAAIGSIVLWAYLAGGIFLLAFGRRFDDATPLTLYQYWYYYGAMEQVQAWLAIAAGVTAAALVVPGWWLFSPAQRSLYGDARFASRRDIKKAELLGDKGIIVGRIGSRYLMFDGQQHVIISAPTRSGKGVGIVIPNLLHWPDSVVVLDIKQENWDITSGVRHRYGQECYLFNPAATDYRTHRYNPLSYIADDPHFRIDDIQKIGNMLFPDQPGTDVIWTATPRTFFLGVVLYLLETPGKPVTLGQVLRETLSAGDGAAYFAQCINDRVAAGTPLSDACVRALNTYLSIASDNTRSGIVGGFRSRLELWMNPLVDAATSGNDFDLRDVRRRRMSIYLGVTPDNLARMAPLLNLFFQQLVDLNTRERPNRSKAIQYTCLLLMDEFTAIGKMPILSKGISYIAGYRLRMMPIIQSPAQLVEVYGKEAAANFQTNHALQIVYPPKASETETARDIAEWLGYQTVKGRSQSKDQALFSRRSPSENVSDQRRALLLPQEITGLGQDRQLIVLENTRPILARKVLFYKDRAFVDRLREVSPSLRSIRWTMPTKMQLDAAIATGELAAPVPMIHVDAHHRLTGQPPAATVPSPGRAGGGTQERPVTPDDIASLAKLTLSQFAIDFSSVRAPDVGQLNEAALHAYADDLCRQAGLTLSL